MITSIIRDATPEEKHGLLPDASKRLERFVMKLVPAVVILLTPLLIYDHFHPVASDIQVVASAVIVVLSVMLCALSTNSSGGGMGGKSSIARATSTPVEVVQVQTTRAIKRADPEDFGEAYYLDVTDCGQRKTLYLWGQYLDELEHEKRFPNTAFEFVRRPGSDEFITFKTIGQYFQAEQTLPAFGEAVWRSGNYPLNGQLLDQTLDTIPG